MPRHNNQRVGVFVDVQNLYYSAKQFYHAKVNFAYILKRAAGSRQLIRAIAYVIKADIKEEENFFDALEKIGYDVKSKDLQIFFGGAKKGDWDVGIAMDIMRMASKLDVVVLVSGDGDFNDLLEHVKALGCRAEVLAFRKTVSSRLLAVADEFIDLDKEVSSVLIKEYKDNKEYKEQKEYKPFSQKTFQKPFRKPIKEETSFLQIINMDQPEIDKVQPKSEPFKEKEVVKEEVKQEINKAEQQSELNTKVKTKKSRRKKDKV